MTDEHQDEPAVEAAVETEADAAAEDWPVDERPLPPLRAALEAVLLVTDQPVAAVTLAQVT